MIVENNFIKYCTHIRGVKNSTAKHYCDSINTISRELSNLGIYDVDHLYEIDSLERLLEIKDLLANNKEFTELNKKGHQMYSAGLNRYLEFAKGEDITSEKVLSLIDTPVDIKPQMIINERIGAKRDRIIVNQVMHAEGYLCEIDIHHKTFVAKSTNRPYMEAHHLIPLSLQYNVNKSLDVYANLVVLCPTCHRLLHFATNDEKKGSLIQLFDERQDRLNDSGIKMQRSEFFELLELRM
ncbi:MAG: HNH endonuclease [Spirochaetaceae bacterium]|nr:HNH endonuclease [Spirochaetaceae bacterium]